MREAGDHPLLPPNPTPYLTDWLFEIGPTVGDGLVTYRDMAAWQQISGVELMPWEAKLLRRLSADYAGQRSKAAKPECIAPFTGKVEDGRDKVSRQFAAMFTAAKDLKRKG